jgi:uncharacterized protein YqjF (DUF2071 family)
MSDSLEPSHREEAVSSGQERLSRRIHYRSLGRADGSGGYDIQIRVPEPSFAAEGYKIAPAPAAGETESLPYWLLERYLLYSWNPRRGSLRSGRVHHSPYVWCSVQLDSCQQQLVHANTPIPWFDRPPDHAVYSPGVDVNVFPLRALDRSVDVERVN